MSKKIAFITNICPHYRIRTFEMLSKHFDSDFYFFSAGDEWYWQQEHGINKGEFNFEYLPGVRLGKTRFTPTLLWKLLRKNYDVYLKCINGRFALPVTYLAARLKKKPFILWTGIWMRIDTPFHRMFFPLTQYIYRNSDAIVVYGEHVKEYLINEGILPEKIFVTAHAVDNASYDLIVPEKTREALRQKLDIFNEQKIILYLGRLEIGKGLTYLVDAFATLARDDSVLVFAGTGSERESLEKLVQEKGISKRVRFSGYVQSEDTIQYYSLAWVYVLPSVTTDTFKEPWGLVVNEAFNQGVPVIATDAVGAAAGGLVEDGINGYVIPERDSNALASRLDCLLSDPDLRFQLGANAKQKISFWNNEKMIEGFRQAIKYVS